MSYRLLLLGLGLTACSRDIKLNPIEGEPLVMAVTSPTYGAFTGSRLIVVTGTISPLDAVVTVNGEPATVEADGTFHKALTFPEADRAMVLDVRAFDSDENARALVPVFDGNDPRLTDPGAIGGLLTPTGLDGLEPPIEEQLNALGWEDQVLAILPAVDTDYFDILPASVTSSGIDVDLAPATDTLTMTIGLHDIAMTSDIVILDVLEFPVTISIGEILFGTDADIGVDDEGMLSLSLLAGQASISGWTFSFGGYDIPTEITDLLMEPLSDLVSELLTGLTDVLLAEAGTLPLGGPFSFDTDLMGTQLSMRLVEVGASPDGVGLGLTVSTEGEAADVMPELAPLAATTPSGLPYQLGLAVHEGLMNTLLEETLSGFLDIDLELDASMSEIIGGGIRGLPGGDQMPENDGMCIGLHAQDAQVVRFEAGTGKPLARLWMPDLGVNIDTIQDGSCVTWLDAQMFAVIDLDLSGSEIGVDLDIRQAYVKSYGAEGVDEDAVGEQLGSVISGLSYLLMSQVSFDLSDLFGALDTTGVAMEPTLISVEPLGEEGRYGIFLDVFATGE